MVTRRPRKQSLAEANVRESFKFFIKGYVTSMCVEIFREESLGIFRHSGDGMLHRFAAGQLKQTDVHCATKITGAKLHSIIVQPHLSIFKCSDSCFSVCSSKAVEPSRWRPLEIPSSTVM